MANYYGTGRTNYVRLKDEASYAHFETLCGLCDAEMVYEDEDPAGRRVAALCNQDDGAGEFGGWVKAQQARASGFPFQVGEVAELLRYEGNLDDEPQIDFLGEAARLLAPGQVLVFQHAGAEKLRFVAGYAVALNPAGERLTLDLNQIYEQAAATFGVPAADISRAQY